MKKTQYENSKKNNKINNSLKLKLPNVMNKTDFQSSLSKSKIKQKSAEDKNSKNLNENISKKQIKENSANNNNANDIILKNEKTVLKRKNKNDILNNKENPSQKNTPTPNNPNEKSKNNDNNTNTVVIQSFDDNRRMEEKKPIRLRENCDNNKNNEIFENKINKKENKNINANKDNKDNESANPPVLNGKNNKEIANNNEINRKIDVDKDSPPNNNNLVPKKENIPSQNQNQVQKKEDIPKNDNSYNLEDLIYENLRLNRSFSEDKSTNIYSFDLEFICRCLSLCLSILIETSKESPHITEINLEALSASNIKYFFFNEIFNDNINLLFDLFDKEVNKNINDPQISPLDRLESLLTENDENINFDIN